MARSTPTLDTTGSRNGSTQTATPRQTLPAPTPEEADRLFSAKRYTEAGRRYSALAREDRLPANRKNHWAYCRLIDVVQRMNARPVSSREWDEIETEIRNFQQLAPSLWYGEYLRNKFAEVRQGRRRPRAQSDNLVVRGSAPDESQRQGQSQPRRFPRLFGKASTADPAQPKVRAAPTAPTPASSPDRADQPLNLPDNQAEPRTTYAQNDDAPVRPQPSTNRAASRSQPPLDTEVVRAGAEPPAPAGVKWQVHETPNFRILHCDARLAKAAGEAAEMARTDQAKRWGSPALRKAWNPRCEIQLYPTGKSFAQATGQPENSPGFSTICSNGNRITSRRTSLRADHPQLLTAILPHEVTHVVLADLFTIQQIPRWADEGMAVLAEPNAEQRLARRNCGSPWKPAGSSM